MSNPYDNYTGNQNSDPYGRNQSQNYYGQQHFGEQQYGQDQYNQQNYTQHNLAPQPYNSNYPEFQPTYSRNAAYAPMTEPKST